MLFKRRPPKQIAAARRFEVDSEWLAAFLGASLGLAAAWLLPAQERVASILIGTLTGKLGTDLVNYLLRRQRRRRASAGERYDDFEVIDAPSDFRHLKGKKFRTKSLQPMYATYRLVQEGDGFRLTVSDLYDEYATLPYPSGRSAPVTLYDPEDAAVEWRLDFDGGILRGITPG